MPGYDYRCRECGVEFTQFMSMAEHDRATPKCPDCGSTKVEKVMSSFFAKTVRKS